MRSEIEDEEGEESCLRTLDSVARDKRGFYLGLESRKRRRGAGSNWVEQ